MERIVLSLLLASMLISQTAMDFFSVLLCLSVFYRWYQRLVLKTSLASVFYRTGIEWVFPIWLLVIGVGLFLAREFNPPWLERLLEFRWIVLFYCLVASFIEIKPDSRVLKWAAAVYGLCCLYGLGVLAFGVDPIRENSFITAPMIGRVGGFFSNPVSFAHTYGQVFCWFFAIGLVAFRWKEKTAWWCGTAVLLSAVSLLMSFTQGVWVGLLLATAVMVFIHSVLGGFVFLGGLSAVVYALDRYWPQFHQSVFQLLNPSSYGADKLALWQTNLKIWKENPVFGVGYGENLRRLPEFFQQFQTQALLQPQALTGLIDNQYLHLLAGTGVFGLLCFMSVIIYFFYLNLRVFQEVSIKNYYHRGLALGCLGSQIMIYVGGLTEANFELPKVRLVVILSWAILVWLAHEYKVLRQRV